MQCINKAVHQIGVIQIIPAQKTGITDANIIIAMWNKTKQSACFTKLLLEVTRFSLGSSFIILRFGYILKVRDISTFIKKVRRRAIFLRYS